MTVFGYDLGDGPQALPVRGLSRAEWAHIRDTYGGLPDQCAVPLISEATGLDVEDARFVWDEWPTYEAETLFEACYKAADTGDVTTWLERVRASASLRLELKVCAEYGVPHSVFLAWPSADQDKAVAAFITQNSNCPGCGAPDEAMTDPTLAEIVGKKCWKCIEYRNTLDEIPEKDQGSYHVSVVPKGA